MGCQVPGGGVLQKKKGSTKRPKGPTPRLFMVLHRAKTKPNDNKFGTKAFKPVEMVKKNNFCQAKTTNVPAPERTKKGPKKKKTSTPAPTTKIQNDEKPQGNTLRPLKEFLDNLK